MFRAWSAWAGTTIGAHLDCLHNDTTFPGYRKVVRQTLQDALEGSSFFQTIFNQRRAIHEPKVASFGAWTYTTEPCSRGEINWDRLLPALPESVSVSSSPESRISVVLMRWENRLAQNFFGVSLRLRHL